MQKRFVGILCVINGNGCPTAMLQTTATYCLSAEGTIDVQRYNQLLRVTMFGEIDFEAPILPAAVTICKEHNLILEERRLILMHEDQEHSIFAVRVEHAEFRRLRWGHTFGGINARNHVTWNRVVIPAPELSPTAIVFERCCLEPEHKAIGRALTTEW